MFLVFLDFGKTQSHLRLMGLDRLIVTGVISLPLSNHIFVNFPLLCARLFVGCNVIHTSHV